MAVKAATKRRMDKAQEAYKAVKAHLLASGAYLNDDDDGYGLEPWLEADLWRKDVTRDYSSAVRIAVQCGVVFHADGMDVYYLYHTPEEGPLPKALAPRIPYDTPDYIDLIERLIERADVVAEERDHVYTCERCGLHATTRKAHDHSMPSRAQMGPVLTLF